MALYQFLIVYNAATQRLISAENLGPDTDRAIARYAECEQKYRGDDDMQIVLIGSDSIATIKRTHGHYFGTTDPAEFFESVKV